MSESPRYVNAEDDECGLLYRPGEMAFECLNYCRLKRGHRSRLHSTRCYRNDPDGFDWTEPEDDGMEWPDRYPAAGLSRASVECHRRERERPDH